MTANDDIRIESILQEIEIVNYTLDKLKDSELIRDTEYLYFSNIVRKFMEIIKHSVTHSPRIYYGNEKTLDMIADTIRTGDSGLYTDGEYYYRDLENLSVSKHLDLINNDEFIFIRFFEGRADFEHPLIKKGDRHVSQTESNSDVL